MSATTTAINKPYKGPYSLGTSLVSGRVSAITAIIFLSLTMIYLLTLTSDCFWDGVTFALQIEKVARGDRGAELLFHQNHLLYNALGYLLYRAATIVAPATRALLVLQVTNAVSAAAAVAAFFRISLMVTGSRYAAVSCSAVLGLSAVWWKMATDADAYIISVLLLLLCLKNMMDARPRWHLAGLALAGAMLFHELASLFCLAAAAAVFWNEKIERRGAFAARMLGLAWGLTIAVYYGCSAVNGINNPLGVIRWANSNPSKASFSFNPIPGVVLLPRKILGAILGHNFGLFLRGRGQAGPVIAAVSILAAAGAAFVLLRRTNPAARSSRSPTPEVLERSRSIFPLLSVWAGVYIVFLIFFEPEDFYYPIFYVPALMLGFGLVLGNRHAPSSPGQKLYWAPAALALLSLSLFNLAFFIEPGMRAGSNAILSRARSVRNIWNDRTTVYYADHNEADTAFEYFNDQARWQRLTPSIAASLDGQITAAVENGGSVWLNRGAIRLVDPSWLAEHTRGEEIGIEETYAPFNYIQLLPGKRLEPAAPGPPESAGAIQVEATAIGNRE